MGVCENRRSRTVAPAFGQHGRAGATQVFGVLPLSAATSLPSDDQIEAGHKRNQLTAGARLVAGIFRNPVPAGRAVFSGQASWDRVRPKDALRLRRRPPSPSRWPCLQLL